ncbi:MAG: delta-60 repeat domain-containing protein [Crocinitomicaceae bacterium]|nr:delta-60 repeat domain-containing protein [Crocinitomicaceae bacterium]
MKKLILFTFILLTSCSFSQTMDWTSLPQEVNDYVFKMCEYDGKLIAGGWFTQAGGAPVNRIATWDGSNWSPLGNGVTFNGSIASVSEMIVYQNELYVSGAFDTAGVVPAHFIAKMGWHELEFRWFWSKWIKYHLCDGSI